jgi:hypothetical protein
MLLLHIMNPQGQSSNSTRDADKMKRPIYFFVAFFLALFLFIAPCAKAQGTYTAASCSYADVNGLINNRGGTQQHKAVNGDVIQIPPGTCTWTSSLVISAGITLIGNGTPNTLPSQFGVGTLNTTLLSNTGTSVPMISASLQLGQTLRISSLIISPVTSTTPLRSPIGVSGTCTSTGCPNFRADNLKFTGWNSSSGNNTYNSGWMMRTDNVYGVADHNTLAAANGAVLLANSDNSAWLGVGTYGDSSWANPDTFGTASQFYFENNILHNIAQDCDIGGGCRITVRFNQYPNNSVGGTGSMAYFHGTDSGQRMRGGRQAELYGNTYTCSGCDVLGIDLRSGTAIVFGNSIAGGGNSVVKLDDYRTQNLFAVWGACDGQGPWDLNDGTTYASGAVTAFSASGSTLTITDSSKTWTAHQWTQNGYPYSIVDVAAGWGLEITGSGTDTISYNNALAASYGNNVTATTGHSYKILRAKYCIDQPARGAGTLLSGSTPSPTGWVNEVLDPVYEFDDSISATIYGAIIGSNTQKFIANRDYYNESKNQAAQASTTSPFDGSSGAGHGTLALRPTSCTTGVGYFATDQGNWNQSDNGFGQGEFFVCTATNTWSLHYTPYTYPHPLIAGGGIASSNPPNPPTNLIVTVQ